jgi:glutaredoxin
MVLAFITKISVAEIYKWTDKNGVIHYSQNKPDEIAVEEFQIKSYKTVLIEENIDIDNTDAEEIKKKPARLRRKKVVMYSAEWCGVCKQAKRHFRKNNVRYTNYDIDKNSNAKKRFAKMGGKGVPVILIGKKRMNGFSAGGFDQIYNN